MAARSRIRDGTPGFVFALRRILQLWRIHGYLDAVFMVRDFRMGVSYFLSDIVVNAGAVTGVWLLAERFGGIGAWSVTRVLFMLGFTIAATGFTSLMFNYNVAWISRRIGRGQLDHLLIQPQPIWMSLLTEGVVPASGAAPFLTGLTLIAWSGSNLGIVATPSWLGLLVVNLMASAAVVLSFSYIWGTLAFWTPRSAEEVSSSAIGLIEQLKPYPLDSLQPALRGGLLSILPAGLIGWLPARGLLGLGASPIDYWATPAASLCLALIAVVVFRKGLTRYERIGSQRYSDFGHRR